MLFCSVCGRDVSFEGPCKKMKTGNCDERIRNNRQYGSAAFWLQSFAYGY